MPLHVVPLAVLSIRIKAERSGCGGRLLQLLLRMPRHALGRRGASADPLRIPGRRGQLLLDLLFTHHFARLPLLPTGITR
eukprot:scaffold8701_cov120-Isochrysis_galbana.AAC.3